MNNDFFERRIKEQLESVNRPMNPSGWDTVKKKLPVPWYLSFLREWGLLAMGGLIFSGLLGNIYYQFKNQQLLKRLYEENSTLKQEVVTLRQTSPPVAQLVSEHRVDTVYIVKKMVVEHRHTYEALATTDNEITDESVREKGVVEGKASKKYPFENKTLTSKVDRGKKASIPKENLTQTGVSAADSAEKGGGAVETQLEPAKDAKTAATAESDSVATNPIASVEKPKRQDTLSNVSPPLAKKSFKFPTPRVRVGVETEVGIGNLGVGPTLELFLSPHFSLTAGLHAHRFSSQEYKTVRDYNRATGLDFTQQFAAVIPPHDHLEEIETSVSTIEIPLGIKYYLPLRKEFSLVFATSTNIDVQAFNQVKFEAYKDGAEQYLSVENRNDPQSLYEYTFGVGVQKKWKRGIAQLEPFANFTFRQPEYAASYKNVFGVKASVWIEFGKK